MLRFVLCIAWCLAPDLQVRFFDNKAGRRFPRPTSTSALSPSSEPSNILHLFRPDREFAPCLITHHNFDWFSQGKIRSAHSLCGNFRIVLPSGTVPIYAFSRALHRPTSSVYPQEPMTAKKKQTSDISNSPPRAIHPPGAKIGEKHSIQANILAESRFCMCMLCMLIWFGLVWFGFCRR